jgi:penicillin-binding protein 1A
MGKTGTTSDFRDALFVGSTYGPQGVTVAVRIGFDDNRTLGDKETGGRAALPIFREIMLMTYQQQLVGSAPAFPREIEDGIDRYLQRRPQERDLGDPPLEISTAASPPGRSIRKSSLDDTFGAKPAARGLGRRAQVRDGPRLSARAPAASRRVFPDHRPAAT